MTEPDESVLRAALARFGLEPGEVFAPLVDPQTPPDDAARAVRRIALMTFDQGCSGPETPAFVRALRRALDAPTCRAPAAILRTLPRLLLDNAAQDDVGPRDDPREGFDTRSARWAPFAEDAALAELLDSVAGGVPRYVAFLAHPSAEVREAAAFALAPHYPGHESVGDALEARLRTEEEAPAARAATMLAYALQRRYVLGASAREMAVSGALSRLLRNQPLVVRVAAALALAHHARATEEVLECLREATKHDELADAGACGVSLAGGRLRLAAARALARCTDARALLDDLTIVAPHPILDVTVGRVAAEALVAELNDGVDVGAVDEDVRATLEALTRHPATFSDAVFDRLGEPLALARALGLRPPTRLRGAVADRAVAALTGSEDLGLVAEELGEGLADDDLLDFVEDLLDPGFQRTRLSFRWPDERPPEVVTRLQAEGDRRAARTTLLGHDLLEGPCDPALLARRADAATGDRGGTGGALAVYVLRRVMRGAPAPEECDRVLRHVASIPELAPHVRTWLGAREPGRRLGALLGWGAAARSFYADLLPAEDLRTLATHHDWPIDAHHALPFLEALGGTDPELQSELLTALAARQSSATPPPDATPTRVSRPDGSSVTLLVLPPPAPVRTMPPRWMPG